MCGNFKRRDNPILLFRLLPVRLAWWVLLTALVCSAHSHMGLEIFPPKDPLGRRIMRLFLDGTVRSPGNFWGVARGLSAAAVPRG